MRKVKQIADREAAAEDAFGRLVAQTLGTLARTTAQGLMETQKYPEEKRAPLLANVQAKVAFAAVDVGLVMLTDYDPEAVKIRLRELLADLEAAYPTSRIIVP